MNAREVMTQGILSIGRNAPVLEAMCKMVDRRVTSLIVEKEGIDGVYGIVTRKDIVNKVMAYSKDIYSVKVSEVMSEPLVTISPEMGLDEIARLMAKTNIRRFPVMVCGEIIGIVSNSDLLKAVVIDNVCEISSEK